MKAVITKYSVQCRRRDGNFWWSVLSQSVDHTTFMILSRTSESLTANSESCDLVQCLQTNVRSWQAIHPAHSPLLWPLRTSQVNRSSLSQHGHCRFEASSVTKQILESAGSAVGRPLGGGDIFIAAPLSFHFFLYKNGYNSRGMNYRLYLVLPMWSESTFNTAIPNQ